MVNNITDMKNKYSDFKKYETEVLFSLDNIRLEKVFKIVRHIKKEKKSGVIAEAGCLSGTFLLEFKQKNWELIGIDIIDRPKSLDPKIKFIQHNLEDGIPLLDSSVDIFYAGEVIEHLYDTDLFLQEIKRVLKDNGYVILTTPNLSSFINRILLLFGKMPRYCEYKGGGAGHIHLYTLEKLTNQLKTHGFKIVTFKGNFLSFPDPTPNKLFRKYLLKYLGDLLPTFSENLIIAGLKK